MSLIINLLGLLRFMSKIILITLTTLLSLLSFSGINNAWAGEFSTCPSLNDARKSNNIWPNGVWLPLDSNDELASDAQRKKFQKSITQFFKAEWSGSFLEMAHCWYAGDNTIHLANDLPKPILKAPWEGEATKKFFHCFAPQASDCPYGAE